METSKLAVMVKEIYQSRLDLFTTKTLNERTYRYTRIKRALFWGYAPLDGFLIAYPEKALLDLLYLQSKGLAIVHKDELDASKLDQARFTSYAKKFPRMKGTDFL